MATPEAIRKKVEDVTRRVEAVRRKKAELQAALQAKKAELASLVQEINAAGAGTRSLGAEAVMTQRDLEALLSSCEGDLVATEQALRAPVAPGEHPVSEHLSDHATRDALDLASVTTTAWRQDFLAFVRGVAQSRRLVLGELKTALERGDDGEALRLARQLVGLADVGPPLTGSDRPSPLETILGKRGLSIIQGAGDHGVPRPSRNDLRLFRHEACQAERAWSGGRIGSSQVAHPTKAAGRHSSERQFAMASMAAKEARRPCFPA